jgi:hypothetical protein
MTIKLLAPFHRDHIPLIGFVNEWHPEELQSLLPLWVAAGSELGNHTCSHIDLNNTPITDFESEIVKGEVAKPLLSDTARLISAIPSCMSAKTLKSNGRFRIFSQPMATRMRQLPSTIPTICSPLKVRHLSTVEWTFPRRVWLRFDWNR